MLSFAAFAPHPPIIIPKIGGDDVSDCQKTVTAMKKLADNFADQDIDTVIVISPHGNLNPQKLTIGYSDKMNGNFSDFNHPEITFTFRGNLHLAEKMYRLAYKNKITTELVSHQNNIYQLDHGILVPLYYLLAEDSQNISLIPLGYSFQSRADHFSFGQIISEIIEAENQNIAVVASGDLSHRIFNDGNNPQNRGKQFDKSVVDNINKFNPKNILNISQDLQNDAGECGYRSLLILLGVLDHKKVSANLLSYQAPFGVGYLVAQFNFSK